MNTLLSPAERETKTRRQLELLDVQLSKEFADVPAACVHREVALVSGQLLAQAHFTDHVAVLTGRLVAEHLRAAATATELATGSAT